MTRDDEIGQKKHGAKRDERGGLPASAGPFPRMTRDHGARCQPIRQPCARGTSHVARSGKAPSRSGEWAAWRRRHRSLTSRIRAVHPAALLLPARGRACGVYSLSLA